MIVSQCLVCWFAKLVIRPVFDFGQKFVFLIPSGLPWPVYVDIKLNTSSPGQYLLGITIL